MSDSNAPMPEPDDTLGPNDVIGGGNAVTGGNPAQGASGSVQAPAADQAQQPGQAQQQGQAQAQEQAQGQQPPQQGQSQQQGGTQPGADGVIGAGSAASQAGGSNTEKDPETWVTGGEPMTGAQRSYLETLAQEAGETLPGDLTKAQASEHIDRLQSSTGRGQQS